VINVAQRQVATDLSTRGANPIHNFYPQGFSGRKSDPWGLPRGRTAPDMPRLVTMNESEQFSPSPPLLLKSQAADFSVVRLRNFV